MAEWKDPQQASISVAEALAMATRRLEGKNSEETAQVVDQFYADIDGDEAVQAFTICAVTALTELLVAARNQENMQEAVLRKMSSPDFWLRLVAIGFLAGVDFKEIND